MCQAQEHADEKEEGGVEVHQHMPADRTGHTAVWLGTMHNERVMIVCTSNAVCHTTV